MKNIAFFEVVQPQKNLKNDSFNTIELEFPGWPTYFLYIRGQVLKNEGKIFCFSLLADNFLQIHNVGVLKFVKQENLS